MLFKSLKNKKNTIVNVILCFVLVYFILHSLYGELGLIQYYKLRDQLELYSMEYDVLQMKKLSLENNISLLHPGSLDIDALSENAKSVLGVADPKEKVLYNNDI